MTTSGVSHLQGAAPAATLSGGPVVQPPLWQLVAERLRDDILGGALAEGARLREIELSEHFGVSRGPIREALRELVRLGLAIELPRRGMVVASPTEADIQEVYIAREALEIAAARLVIERAHDGELARLRDMADAIDDLHASGDRAGGRALDMDFHRALFVIAGTKQLSSIFDQLAAQTLLLLRVEDERGPVASRVPEPGLHRAIADALIARDRRRTERAISSHFADMSNRPFPDE